MSLLIVIIVIACGIIAACAADRRLDYRLHIVNVNVEASIVGLVFTIIVIVVLVSILVIVMGI